MSDNTLICIVSRTLEDYRLSDEVPKANATIFKCRLCDKDVVVSPGAIEQIQHAKIYVVLCHPCAVSTEFKSVSGIIQTEHFKERFRESPEHGMVLIEQMMKKLKRSA